MRLVAGTVYALRIPFVEAFRHSATERVCSESVVVRVADEAGCEGFGEGAPRPYVTGERVETVLDHLTRVLWPGVVGRELPRLGGP
ncbi:MAG: enolase, partial [Candidatus Rokubacteria bacterium]|nr:enolase [Candidatus Rokubacteria bacterium]